MVFDQDLLEEIKQRADIVDIISSRVNVIKKGRFYYCICPFHDDHKPSMVIYKETQSYFCYTCKHGGNVFTFIADYEKISFSEAVLEVCNIIGFDDPRLHKNEVIKPVDVDIDNLYKCINELQKFYEYSLQTNDGLEAKEYLKLRAINDKQIEKFSLGFAPNDGKKAITFLQKKGFSLKNIQDIGISLVKTNGTSDNNAGRLIFPIKNAYGQVVGFSARNIKNDGETRYINSPDTKIFKKGDILYNFNLAKQSARHDEYIYIVEGFMDVFALDEIGINSVVALMGTKLSNEHINMLKKLNVEIRLCLDGDKPGQDAMMSLIQTIKKSGLNCRIVSLPGEIRDPDEILKQDGPEKLKLFVNSLVDSFDFIINYYKNVSQIKSEENAKKVIYYFAPMLKQLKSKIDFDNYVYKLAEITNFNYNAIVNYVNELKIKQKENDDVVIDIHSFKNDKKVKRLELAEKLMLTLMANNPDALDFFNKNVKYFVNETYEALAHYFVDYASKYEKIDISMMIDIVSQSDHPNKKQLIYELCSIPIKKNETNLAEQLNECLSAINEERNKNYNKANLDKAIIGKSPKEQAAVIDEYIKSLKQN